MVDLYRPGDLQAAGVSRAALRHGLQTGRWVRLRRGVFCTGTAYAGDEQHRFVLRVRAALLVAPPDAVASHLSAAALWRLARSGLHVDDGRVHLIAPYVVTLDGCVVHRTRAGVDTAWPHGVPATGLASTVVDCARVLPFREGVVLADSALLAEPRLDLRPSVLACGGWPGAGQAQRVVAFADGRAESVLESLARVLWHEHGLPAPDLQRTLGRDGRFLGRVDFYWAAARLVVEVDGRGKYDDPGEHQRERQRQNALIAADYTVLRFGWADVVHRGGLIAGRVREALATSH